MIRNLLFKKRGFVELLVSAGGAIVGLFIVLISVQFYTDYKSIVAGGKDLIASNTIIIQKKISALNTLQLKSSTFSPNEIKELKEESFIENIDYFEASRFKITTTLGKNMPNIPNFYMELFFESLPDQYLEKNPSWFWEEGSDLIPIILPKDFIDIYNSGFSGTQGLPKIPKETLYKLEVNFTLSGKTKGKYRGRVVGFTNKVSSVLVPMNFLKFANQTYAHKPTAEANRLILTTSPDSHGKLLKLLDIRGYEANASKLELSKQKSEMHLVLTVFLLIGGLILLLSIMNFIQYSQLLISKAQLEISTLLLIGYNYKDIGKSYFQFFVRILLFICGISLLLTFMAKYFVNSWMVSKGYDPSLNLSLVTYLLFGLFVAFYLLANASIIFKTVKKMASPA